MSTASCSQCGKHDSLMNMHTCICFEHTFCSEEHFNQHPHSKVVDEIHAQDVNIGPNIRRLFKKAKFEKALNSLKREFIDWLNGSGLGWPDTIRDFREQISSSRRDDFQGQLYIVLRALQNELSNKYPTDINEYEIADVENVLTKTSEQLIRIWKSENRLALLQTAKAIKNAWITFLMALVKYNYIRTESNLLEIDTLIPRVARILGGGKDELAAN